MGSSSTSTTLSEFLSDAERERLALCESVIERGQQTFLDVGSALRAIRDQALYRETHTSFESYLRERWGMARAHGYRLIKAAAAVEALSPIGDSLRPLPANEAQARPLTMLSPEVRERVWAGAVEAAAGHQPTAAQVQAVVNSLKALAPGAVAKAARELRAEKDRARRHERLAMVAAAAASRTPLLGLGRRYPILVGDPAWPFEKIISCSRSLERHYETMSIEAIRALPVDEIAADDALLVLWVPSALLPDGLSVIEAWRFTYVTSLVWVKNGARPGMGSWFRIEHELALVAKRGSIPPPDEEVRASSVITSPRGEHSAKPDRLLEILDAAYPTLAKVELFARRQRPGWDAWGDQIAASGAENPDAGAVQEPGDGDPDGGRR
jgi:N6-adenosine-specific RNA methylase IME4